MTYLIAIDWLALHCHYEPPRPDPSPKNFADGSDDVQVWEPDESAGGDVFGTYPWRYKLADYGTRQFARLYRVAMPNAEGGWDDFAEVQASPHSGILYKNSVIVRFVNRTLYLPDFWELATRFLSDNNFAFKGISRIDICADFNQFKTIAPRTLIEDFAAKKLRHVGRGVGALYFNHGKMRDENAIDVIEYSVKYTGLSFGTHASDARAYLYDKSFELMTQGDKPWIRDTWTAAGLDVRHVWRLEISLKSKGCKFKDKISGNKIIIDNTRVKDRDELTKIYHTFEKKLFAFVKNRKGITNITREPRLELFTLAPVYSRGVIRNLSAGNRFDRMFIKALYQMGDLYRGAANIDTADLAQSFAVNIAESTDQVEWMSQKVREWERPTHK